MRTLVFLGILAIIGLVVTGAIKMQKSPNDNTISIQIDKQRVSEDAQRVVDDGKELLQEAETAVQSRESVQK
jgi:hypothetical protein